MRTDNRGTAWSDLVRVRKLFGSTGLKPNALALPIVMGVGVGLLEGIGLWLLVQLVKGMMGMDYSFINDSRPLKAVAANLPEFRPLSNNVLFLILVGLTFSALFFKSVLQYLSYRGIFHLTRKFCSELRKLLFRRHMTFGKLYFDRTNAGFTQSLILEYTERIAFRLTDIHQFFTCFFTLLACVGMMCYISLWLTISVLIVFPALHFSSNWLNSKIREVSESCIAARGELSRRLNNVLTCMPLVKSYCMESREEILFSDSSDNVERLESQTDSKILLVVPIQEVVALGLLLLLVSAIALIVLKQGTARLPGFFVFFYIIRRAAATFGSMSHFRTTLSALAGPIDEIIEVLEDRGKHFVVGGSASFPGLKSQIQFNDTCYSYADGTPVLNGLSFSIKRGHMTAIIGPSGAGKTTIINLLLRYYECLPATILIDGEDIRSFGLNSLRNSFALVSQETMLFNDTIRNNITYGMRAAVSNESLDEVVIKARLKDYVAKLPAGYETLIGDRGVQLSGGEKQRISIARAMLKNSEILIFDEATSALDTNTEVLIQGAIDEAVIDKTAIVIAHRLSTIKKADKIVVLEDGRVVENGSLSELLEAKGKFYQYWEEQRFK